MKEKTKKTYYCDFCKKHLHKKPSMEHHEKICTANPNRRCNLCGRKENLIFLINKFKKQMFCPQGNSFPADQIKQPKLDDIMDNVENCPICSLAIIRLTGLHKWPYHIEFDFKKELEIWWTNKNEEDHISEMQAY